MLRGLDAIDWANLNHAYGAASDVPDLIRSLTSPLAEIREGGMFELYSTIWHQGTVYEATAAAVPFLYELLAAEGVPDQMMIAGLIAEIATGRSYLKVHAAIPAMAQIHESICAKNGTTLSQELAREREHVAAVRRAVARQLDLLYPYLRDPEPHVRMQVATAIGCFPEIAARLLPDLQVALQDEADESTREALRSIIANLT